MAAEFYVQDPKTGAWRTNLHRAQEATLASTVRIPVMLGATGSGKTQFEPVWAVNEWARVGPSSGLVVTPTLRTAEPQLIPHFKGLLETRLGLGEMTGRPFRFHLSKFGMRKLWGDRWNGVDEHFVNFGYAEDPDSIISLHAGWAVADEVGHPKFKFESWVQLQNRVGQMNARILAGTSPFHWGWFKDFVVDRACREWRFGDYETNSPDGAQLSRRPENDPDIELFRFPSIMNPAYSRKTDEESRRKVAAGTYPKWMYLRDRWAEYTLPEGMVLDSFDRATMLTTRAEVEKIMTPFWEWFLGIDFGGVNTVAVFVVRDPETNRFFLIDEYLAPHVRPWRTPGQHVDAIRAKNPHGFTKRGCVGGSWSENQWRHEFRRAGLDIVPAPVREVETRIQRTNELFKTGKFFICREAFNTLDQIQSYRRKLDDAGRPTDDIEDKEDFHLCDALCYLSAALISRVSGRPWNAKSLSNLPERRITVGRRIETGGS